MKSNEFYGLVYDMLSDDESGYIDGERVELDMYLPSGDISDYTRKEFIKMSLDVFGDHKSSFKKQANKFEKEINATLTRKAIDVDDPEIAPFLDSVYTVNVHSEITDSHDTYSTTLEKGEKYDFEDLVFKIDSEGFFDLSSSPLRKPKDAARVWVTTEEYEEDYETKIDSLHIEKVDGNKPEPEAIWAVYKAAELL